MPGRPNDRAAWERDLHEQIHGPAQDAWRDYMRRVYARLTAAWLPATGGGRLKTDLFEEATSSRHPLGDLGDGAMGIDLCPAVACLARRRLQGQGREARLLVGDLRALPIVSNGVAQVLSGSSLDHFETEAELRAGLSELQRILAPGGVLALVLDNPENPVLWLRSRLPFEWLRGLRLVPYYVGATLDRHAGRRCLEAVGLEVLEVAAVAHAPRLLAIVLIRWLEALGAVPAAAALGRSLDAWEALGRWQTRFLTGYYLAFHVRKPP